MFSRAVDVTTSGIHLGELLRQEFIQLLILERRIYLAKSGLVYSYVFLLQLVNTDLHFMTYHAFILNQLENLVVKYLDLIE